MLDKLSDIITNAKHNNRPAWQHTTHVAIHEGETWTVATNSFVLVCIKGGDAVLDESGQRIWEVATRKGHEAQQTVALDYMWTWANAEKLEPCPKCKGSGALSHKCGECELHHAFECLRCKGAGNVSLPAIGKIGEAFIDLAMLRMALYTLPEEAEGVGLSVYGKFDPVYLFADGWRAAIMGCNQDTSNVPDFEL